MKKKKTKKRLIVFFTIPNIINYAAIVASESSEHEDYYAYFGLKSNLESSINLANNTPNFKCFYSFATNNPIFRITKEELAKNIPIKDFDELFLQFNGADFKAFSALYKKAKIYLVEDGLSSYLKHSLEFNITRTPSAIYSYNYCGLIPHECKYNKIKNIKISPDGLKSVYKRFESVIPAENNENSVIICAQEIFTSQLISYEKELELYVNAIKTALNNGYNVIFKEHPRSRIPFFPQLKQIFPTPNFKLLEIKDIPIEFYCRKNQPRALVSVFSTSLFIASEIFGTKCVTVDLTPYKPTQNRIKNFDFANMLSNTFFPQINNDSEQPKVTERERFLLDLKELEMYKFFVSKKEFYQLKTTFIKYNFSTSELAEFSIPPAFANIFQNQFYFDYIFYNEKIYANNMKIFIKILKSAKNPLEFLRYCCLGLKAVVKIL